MDAIKDRNFVMGASLWLAATLAFFAMQSSGVDIPPVAENAFVVLLTAYIPVLVLAVFLLLYLTRKRDPIAWEDLYAVDRSTAKKEAWQAVIYLVVTQFILGFVLGIGLHFPGTAAYTTGSHDQGDVWTWVIVYTVVYTILPLMWLRRRGFSFRKLARSFRCIRDMWIIVAYWALDFFGPIFTGSADFLGGITASQYA